VNNTNTSRARALGAELRAARKAAGMTLEQLAGQLGRAHSDLSRWETGKRLPSEADTAAVLGILRVTGDERHRLLQLARDAADPNWVAPGVDKQLAALIEDEKTASRITNVEPLIVPGLLQTEGYATSIMVGAGATRGQAEQRVLVRLGRQRLLDRRNAPELVAIIGEHALHYPPCSRDVMVDQLRHLSAVAERPNVTIMVLPFDVGYSPALEGPFVLLEFTQGAPVVQQEHYRSTTTLTDTKDVRDYVEAVAAIRGATLSPADSAELITKLGDELERAL
jgi:transcriptional regulator with XRE-family HTH domain